MHICLDSFQCILLQGIYICIVLCFYLSGTEHNLLTNQTFYVVLIIWNRFCIMHMQETSQFDSKEKSPEGWSSWI
jgi:hypothetical protein